MSFTSLLDRSLLDHVWGDVAFVAPSTIYVGLSTTPIAKDGTNITEPAVGNYARVAVTNNLTNWPAATTPTLQSEKQNGEPIEFPEATDSWGEIVDFFFADDVMAGDILAFGSLDTPREIVNGDIARFSVEAITIILQ